MVTFFRRLYSPGAAQRPLSGQIVCLVCMLLIVAPASAQVLPSFGGDRAGTIGFQFLKIPADARSAALGQTVVSNAMDASSLFWNPALASQTEDMQIGFSHTAYHADVRVEYAALTYPLGRGGFTLGASIQALDSGSMKETTEFQPFGTGREFAFTDLAAGLTVSQTLTDLFSYGITGKYVRESVAGISASTLVFDLGVFYRVGTTGAQMAVAIRNFGLDAAFEGELTRATIGGDGTTLENDFESVTPPTTFLLGISYEVFQNNPSNKLLLSGQLSNPADNAETFNVGAEWTWNNLLIVRTGYRIGVEEFTWPSVGGGLMLPDLFDRLGVRFDYGLSHLERLGSVHRVGLNLSL